MEPWQSNERWPLIRAAFEEREGFEPSVRFRTHDFQSCPFGHSGTSPDFPRRARTSRARPPPTRNVFEERVGVEPTLGLRPNLISNQALSATQPSLRGTGGYISPDR